MNIRKKIQILALIAVISLGGVAQVKAEPGSSSWLGSSSNSKYGNAALVGSLAAIAALQLKDYFSEKSRLKREKAALLAADLDIKDKYELHKDRELLGYNLRGVVSPRQQNIKNTLRSDLAPFYGSSEGQRLIVIDRRLQQIAAADRR